MTAKPNKGLFERRVWFREKDCRRYL